MSLRLGLAAALACACGAWRVPTCIPREKQELTFTAGKSMRTPILTWWCGSICGPGFDRRVYGFWDGGSTFHLRLAATSPGDWTWSSGANVDDPGLTGKSGTFTAVAWTEEKLAENPLRRGFPATANGHALEYADGTPFLPSGTPGTPPARTGSNGTTMRSAPSVRRPASRTTCAIARRRVTTG